MALASAALTGHSGRPCPTTNTTRTDDWTTAGENPISFDEWINHAQAAASLIKVGSLSLRNTEPSEQPVFASRTEHHFTGGAAK